MSIVEGVVAPASGAGRPRFEPFSSLGNDARLELSWVWDGLIAWRQVTMLVGDAYEGKSTLVAALLAAMREGEPLLGRATRKASALIVSEESSVVLAERAQRFGLLDSAHSLIDRERGVLDWKWPTLVSEAADYAVAEGHELLVVDTFPGLAGLEHEQENDSGAITAKLQQLSNAAGKGLAVLFLHHTNKSGGIRGSGAFRSVSDVSVVLRQRKPQGIKLSIESRFAEASPPNLSGTLVRAGDGWFYTTGSEATTNPAVAHSDTDQRLLDALREAGPIGLTYKEIGALPGLSVDVAKKRLPDWLEQGLLEQYGAGVKGNPHRWVLP